MKLNLRYERPAHKTNYSDFSGKTQLIWHPSQVETYYDKPINAYCHFRKTFSLDQPPKVANIRVFADTRYALYVNGQYITRGPVRSDPRWQFYDEVNVAEHLVAGKNVIAVFVLHFGYGTGQSMHRVPALFLECDLMMADAKQVLIGTDESWKVIVSPAYDPNAPRVNGCKGPVEIMDNQLYPHGWTQAEYDDSQWEQAQGRFAAMSPFWNLRKRPIPLLVEKDVQAKAIIAAGVGNAVKGYDLKHLHWQLKEEIAQLELSHVFVMGTECECKPVDKDKFSYVLVDLERVEVGYLQLNVTGYGGDIVDVVYAEELLDGKPHINGVNYRPMTRFILKDGENELQVAFNYEAFRYVLLIFRNHIRANRLSGVGIRTKYYPMERQSTFTCDDPALNKLWDISVHTLKLCMQDGFLDSPSREQQQWMGDGRYQAIMNYYVSGDSRMHKKLLEQIAQSQDYEGMTTSRYPDENHNLPPIPSFCLQWVNSFGDLYHFTGELELAQKLWNGILSAMRWFSGLENQDGLLEDVPYWQYYELGKDKEGTASDFQRGGIIGMINLMYAEAMDTVTELAAAIGDYETERFFRTKGKKLKKEIKQQLWEPELGAYVDCVKDGQRSESVSEITNVLAILVLHEQGEKRVAQMVEHVFEKETRMNVKFVSAYSVLPYLRAMAKIGRNDIAVRECKQRYQKMLDFGATSTWEQWDLYYQTGDGQVEMNSACHAWSAAPIVLIAENILGIDVGNKKGIKALPLLQGIDSMKAEIITPKGAVEIEASEHTITRNSVQE